MKRDKLLKLFRESINIFFTEEVENILNGVAERNLCGRLAIYITDKLKEYEVTGYYADTEYNRKQNGLKLHDQSILLKHMAIVQSVGKN
jgi:hypothetical protein